MNLRIDTKVSFYFLLCLDLARSSKDTFLKNETLSNLDVENVLQQFFLGFKMAYLMTNKTRHITFVGAEGDDLQQVRSLLESHPYIICNDIQICKYSDVFSRGNIVVFYLDDLNEDKFLKKDKFLLRCRKCKILFIFKGQFNVEEIRLIFIVAMAKNVQYIQFAHVQKSTVTLYGNFFGKNCSVEVRLLNVWKPGLDLHRIHTRAFQLLKDLNGCTIYVSSLNSRPKMVIQEEPDGSLKIIGGREGKLLLTLAETLNFTLALSYPTEVNRMKYSRKMSIINDVALGVHEVGIGGLLQTTDLNHVVGVSISYDSECMIWGVPLIINWPSNFLWVEFSLEVWIPVGLVFVFICAVGYADQNLNFSKTGKSNQNRKNTESFNVFTLVLGFGLFTERRRNVGLFTIVLDHFAVLLGNPAAHVSSFKGGRFILIVYLYYAMVITTAYKSSLSAILATDDGTPMFLDVEGILKGNLSVGGSLYDYKILEEQRAASHSTSMLLERFVVENDEAQCLHRLKYHRDYAFLSRRSSLNYNKQKMVRDRESITFDTLRDCVLDYYTVIIFKKASFLRRPTNNMIKRLGEAGLLDHWDYDEMYSEKIFEGGNTERYFGNDTSYKFRTVWILYFSCIVLSLIVFLIEVLTAQFNFKKKFN